MANPSSHTASLAKKYAEKYHVSTDAATLAIRQTFDVIADELRDGNDVTIYKFGRFKRINVKGKQTKQPGTDHYSSVPDHTLIHFSKSRNADFEKHDA